MGKRYTIWSALAFIAVWIAFAAFVTALLLIAFFPRLSFAHELEVKTCFNSGREVKLKRSYVHPNGLYAELYAKQGGGVVLALSPITGYQYNWEKDGKDDLVVEHAEHPIAYFVDAGMDGTFDESFVDKGGQGKCSEIEHYNYFDQRRDGEDDPNNPRKEASERWSLG